MSYSSLYVMLHRYGSVVPINARDPSKFQHQVCVYVCISLIGLPWWVVRLYCCGMDDLVPYYYVMSRVLVVNECMYYSV